MSTVDIKFEVEVEDFIEWVGQVQSRFRRMVETMKNVAEIIRIETIPLVPLDTSALEQSYEYVYVENSPYILLGVGFDAVDEKSGFHYAEYQHEHEDINHPRRGVPFYLTKGIRGAEDEAFHLIETDYLSLFEGANVSRGRTNIDPNLHERYVFLSLGDWIGS